MKYNYPRSDISIRISGTLLDLISEASYDLHTSKQDIALYALLWAWDAAQQCPDWETIPDVLKDSK